MDAKNAFLHRDLQEEVYIEQPLQFVALGESDLVCRLRKALYGLKQSLRAWFGKFSEVVQQFSMHKCQPDHSMFSSIIERGRIMLMILLSLAMTLRVLLI